MNLAQALKQKNRLAGELVRQQKILERENARRNDSVSKVNRVDVWTNILKLSESLGELKGKITQANVNIYPALERMAELKSRINFINGLEKRDGEEVTFIGRDQEKQTYQWNSFINQERSDSMISEIQSQLNALQDEVDTFNHVTEVPE